MSFVVISTDLYRCFMAMSLVGISSLQGLMIINLYTVNSYKGADQPAHTHRNENFTFLQTSQLLNIMHKGDGFSAEQNLLEKAYFNAKMSGPASSDFWKAP